MKRAIAAAALMALTACRAETAPVKPTLYVLTSLPLLFDEGFAVGPAKGEAAAFLRAHYVLKPIDLPSQLPPHATLLAAQPRALPAEELVALDAWVRGGGKMLLLADPMLEWPSERPFGDRTRPPLAYPDTGLLAHWGLRLEAPDKRGLVISNVWRSKAAFLSPGKLVASGQVCQTDDEGLIAQCMMGVGNVTVVADADWLNVASIDQAGARSADNLPLLDKLIALLTPIY